MDNRHRTEEKTRKQKGGKAKEDPRDHRPKYHDVSALLALLGGGGGGAATSVRAGPASAAFFCVDGSNSTSPRPTARPACADHHHVLPPHRRQPRRRSSLSPAKQPSVVFADRRYSSTSTPCVAVTPPSFQMRLRAHDGR